MTANTTRRRSLRPWSITCLSLLSSCSIYDAGLLLEAGEEAPSASGGSEAATGGQAQTGGAVASGGLPPGSGGDSQASGGSSTGGMGGTPGSGGQGSEKLELIDDLEDNEPTILFTKMRNGRWNVYAGAGEEAPPPGENFSQMHDIDGDAPHEESSYAAYMKSGTHSDFGAVLNVTMRSGFDESYDASAYSGLHFFAKAGSDSSRALRVRLVTGDTDPRGGLCETSGSTEELCYDHYLYPVTLREDWKEYTVNFSDFMQTNSGKQFDSLALDRLYTIEFHMPGSNDFELFVDDLSFTLP